MIVVTCDWDCNKGITNPYGVFSGVTRYNWWSELIKEPEHCTIYINLSRSTSSGQTQLLCFKHHQSKFYLHTAPKLYMAALCCILVVKQRSVSIPHPLQVRSLWNKLTLLFTLIDFVSAPELGNPCAASFVCLVVICLAYSTLKIEAVNSSETLVNSHRSTRHHNSRCENVISIIISIVISAKIMFTSFPSNIHPVLWNENFISYLISLVWYIFLFTCVSNSTKAPEPQKEMK
jgi:hypothetical protein